MMSDLIRRQDVIDAVFELSDKLSNEMLFIDAIVDEIENVPSAEPEWTAKVKEGWGLAMCCACKKRVFPYDKYCSHCGAKLDWSGNETD